MRHAIELYTTTSDKLPTTHKMMISPARLAQSVEQENLNLGVVGSSPLLGIFFVYNGLENFDK
jgi:hypothetical protein